MECISRCQSSKQLQRGSNRMHFKQRVQLQGRGQNAGAYFKAKSVCVKMNPFSMFSRKEIVSSACTLSNCQRCLKGEHFILHCCNLVPSINFLMKAQLIIYFVLSSHSPRNLSSSSVNKSHTCHALSLVLWAGRGNLFLFFGSTVS